MRKIVIRADDVGYTPVNNIGSFETMENGVVTAADVMLDSPGTVDALERLKKMPWISVGWHPHFWCTPVLPPEKVPSLTISGSGRFRKDIYTAANVDYGEALAECRAEMERCVDILGRVPDTIDIPRPGTMGEAVLKTCDEYGIVHHFAAKPSSRPEIPSKYPSEKWAGRNIVILDPAPAYADLQTPSVDEVEKYDPALYYIEDRGGIMALPEDVITEQSWHPGYLDYFSYKLGDHGPKANRFTLGRVKDVEALTSIRLRDWIKENHIQLINFRDALYGTNEYQNHLRHIGSDLYTG